MNRIIALIAITFFPITSLFAHKMFQLVDMGLLEFIESDATSINNKGEVCGTGKSEVNVFTFVWDSENKLKRLLITPSSNPIINNNSTIFGSRVGYLIDGIYKINQEILYKWNPFLPLSSNFQSYGFPKSQANKPFDHVFKRSVAWSANDKEEVLVMNQTKFEIKNDWISFDRESDYKVWIVDKDYATRIDNADFKAGFSMNNHSQVIGCKFTNKPLRFGPGTEKGDLKAAIYNFKDKSVRVLSFASFSIGMDINDKGQIAGIFYNELEEEIKGFIKGDLDNKVTDLIVITNFFPFVLNNNAQCIGKFLGGHNKDKPALWDKGILLDVSEMTDLMDDQGNIWDSIDSFEDINDLGMIVGKGKYKGNVHGLLLIPVAY